MNYNLYKYTCIFLILIIVVILCIFFYNKHNNNNIKYDDGYDVIFDYKPNIIDTFNNIDIDVKNNKPIVMKKYIWVFWECVDNKPYPTYINLCMKIMKKHLDKYDLIFLNEKTIKDYLPDLRDDFENLKIAQKVDYYRVCLLYKYGGIWIDADIIIMKDIKPIFDKLEEKYDYVGFGCTGTKCNNGYLKPSNWIMASRPKSVLMKACLDKLNDKLDKRNIKSIQNDSTYHDYGKIIIWQSLEDLKQIGYNYYHFTSEYDGTRDINKHWIHSPNFFSLDDTIFLDKDKIMFVVLYNSEINQNKDYQWINICDENRLLDKNKEWLCRLFKQAITS